ncbi:MAG: hypothetical protein HZB39_08645, partial [Planctomycetes bacterium]|nr:hypothetical protein [Planctomycetota bacterium]
MIVLCHGAGGGTGFFWGGVEYSGFGGAAGEMAVPAGFNARRNVTVKFCCCHSAHDPDGNGPDLPLTTKIVGAMGGAGRGHQAMGFDGFAITPARYTFVGGTQAQQDAARQCLIADPSWQNNPPTNRSNPPPTPNQATAAQAVIDACAGAGGAGVVRITLIDYRPPVDQANLPAPGQGPAGCGCRAAPGCGFG